jgi:hypothetical protein
VVVSSFSWIRQAKFHTLQSKSKNYSFP